MFKRFLYSISFTYLLLLIFVSIFTACSDNDDNLPPTIESNTVSANIDGEVIKFSNLVITKQDYTNDETSTLLHR